MDIKGKSKGLTENVNYVNYVLFYKTKSCYFAIDVALTGKGYNLSGNYLVIADMC